jgi:putative NADPH-quinone reductase
MIFFLSHILDLSVSVNTKIGSIQYWLKESVIRGPAKPVFDIIVHFPKPYQWIRIVILYSITNIPKNNFNQMLCKYTQGLEKAIPGYWPEFKSPTL